MGKPGFEPTCLTPSLVLAVILVNESVRCLLVVTAGLIRKEGRKPMTWSPAELRVPSLEKSEEIGA